ncbi:MAG TPA: GntR family transcriptional regulator, partial [Pyrinomonadaceae bacterium]|nr:GntR family transcriptional regulator [Pyrinomonadaceae bacterium]
MSVDSLEGRFTPATPIEIGLTVLYHFFVKLWIAKNSEVPVHEQLVTQITIGIVSGDLAANEKLPSTREIARRFDIHSNTVSAAYHRLVEERFLEFQKGKGYFVLGNAASSLTREQTIAFLLDGLIYQANELGFNLGDLIRLLKVRQTQRVERIRLVESDSGLGAIIQHEL